MVNRQLDYSNNANVVKFERISFISEWNSFHIEAIQKTYYGTIEETIILDRTISFFISFPVRSVRIMSKMIGKFPTSREEAEDRSRSEREAISREIRNSP